MAMPICSRSCARPRAPDMSTPLSVGNREKEARVSASCGHRGREVYNHLDFLERRRLQALFMVENDGGEVQLYPGPRSGLEQRTVLPSSRPHGQASAMVDMASVAGSR